MEIQNIPFIDHQERSISIYIYIYIQMLIYLFMVYLNMLSVNHIICNTEWLDDY
jgi:hypothetical protein